MNMPKPEQATSGVLDKLGQALGLVVGIIATGPVNQAAFPYFQAFVLNYTDYQYWVWLKWAWIGCLFFLLYSLTSAVLSTLVLGIKKACLHIALGINIRKERSKWQ